LFNRHAGDAVYRNAFVVVLSGGVSEYSVPPETVSVMSMDTSQTIGEGINTLFSPLNQMYNMGFLNFFSGTFGSGLVSYEVGLEYLRQTELELTAPFSIHYNKYDQTLTVTPTPYDNGDMIFPLVGVVECYTQYDPGTGDSDIYNELWVKRYSVALCKIALGTVWGKYSGMTIPGGAILNYANMIAEGTAEKNALYEELIKTEGEPLGFFMA
jgi:hypothetical protein